MSPVRIPDDDSLRAPSFAIPHGPPKSPDPVRKEPPPFEAERPELHLHLLTEVRYPLEEDGR